jgi:predicted acyltransferase
MTLSFASRIARGVTRGKLALHVARRSALIFVIGLFLNGFPKFDFSSIRIMGVLQRIAVCYLVAGLMYLLTYEPASAGTNAATDPTPGTAPGGPSSVRANTRVMAVAAVVLLAGYWALMTFVPVPGVGVGHLDKENNLGAYIDRTVMGGHLWSESKTWDPEGLLSTLPAIASLLIGILAGEWLRSERSAQRKVLALIAAGIVLLFAGRALHPYFPINKNLWTSSFVLLTSGFAMVALAACFWIVDVRAWRVWIAPFLVFGMNAILAYALAALVSEISTDFEFHLGYAIFFVLVIFALLWPFYRYKIFLRV